MSSTASKNKCQFCVAYFPDEVSSVEHSENCFARISAFLSRDGIIKFACMVCRDVFPTPAQLGEHERMHRLPGGFNCTICAAAFLCERDRVEHLETNHEIFECLRCDDGKLISTEAAYIQHCEQEHNSQSGYAFCLACGATFEEKSHLRFHTETECGYLHGWTCIECAAIFTTEEGLTEHSVGHSTNEIKMEKDDIDFQFEHVTTKCPGSLFEDNGADGDSKEIEKSLFDGNVQWEDQMIVDMKFEEGDVGGNMETEENASDDGNDSPNESERNLEVNVKDVGEDATREGNQDKHRCEFCSRKYMHRNNLTRHLKKHHQGGEILRSDKGWSKSKQCKICSRSFESEQILDDHFRLSHARYQCDMCDYVTMSKKKLRSHFAAKFRSKSDDGVIGSTFGTNGKSGNSSAGIKRRHRTFKRDKYTCNKCGFKTFRKGELYTHFESECGSKIVNQCIICKETFKMRYHYYEHIKTHPKADLICSKCDMSFVNYLHFSTHMKSHDKQKCKICSKEFVLESTLRNHMRTHTQENSLQCLGCNERFDNLNKLLMHRRKRPETCMLAPYVDNDTTEGRAGFLNVKVKVQRDENRHKCDICDKCFSSEKKLVKHKHDDHKFECERCGFTTIRRGELNSHFDTQCGRKKNHTCLVCNESFFKEGSFQSHKKTHSVFNCTKCVDTSFSTYHELYLHSRLHASKNFQCTVCNKKFVHEAMMQLHMAKHIAMDTYKCHGCDKGFGSLLALRKHRSQSNTCKQTPFSSIDTTGIKPSDAVTREIWRCRICYERFRTEKGFKKHQKIHGADGSKKFKCIKCPKFFAKDEQLQHIKEEHADELKCPDCINHCTNREVFKAHITYDHLNLPRPKPPLRHTCAKCGISFVAKQRFEDHEKSKCGQDPLYKCEICDKILSTEHSLQKHMVLHQDDTKPFICSYCGKGWRTKHALNTHLVYHTGEKRHACTTCGKRFFDIAGLRSHEPTHTGIKPYMCQCGDRFSCISNLQSHRRARKTTCGLLPLITKKFPNFSEDSATKS